MKKRILSVLLALVLVLSFGAECFAAEPIAEVTNGTETVKVDTMAAMAAAVNPDGTTKIKLLADVSNTDGVIMPYSCHLDLGGFTLKNPNGDAWSIGAPGSANGISVVENGTLDAKTVGFRVYGGFQVKNATVISRTRNAVGIYETSRDYNAQNLVEGSVLLSGERHCICFLDKGQNGLNVRVENSTLAAVRFPVAFGVTSDGTCTVEFGENVVMYSASENALNHSRVHPQGLRIVKAGARESFTHGDLTISDALKWETTTEEPETPGTLKPQGTPTTGSTDNTVEEVLKMQQAVVELAAAYYRRAADTRYDYTVMTPVPRLAGVERVSTHDPVGSIAPDHIYYSNCSQFVYALYYETFGRGPLGDNGHNAVVSNYNKAGLEGPEVVLELASGANTAEREEFVRLAKELLQPGDTINSSNVKQDKGHSMLYVGDYLGDGGNWVIHSNTNKIPDGSMGADGVKTIQRTDWKVFLGTGTYGAMTDTVKISILRPTNVMDFDMLLPAGHSRLKFPGLDLIRQGSVWQYMDVQTGQEIEITQIVKNSSQQAWQGLTIADPVPVGAEIVTGTISHGGSIRNDKVFWNLSLQPGQEVKLTYTVKVTAEKGGVVELAAGLADGTIPTRDLVWYVGGEPVSAEPFKALQNDPKVEGLTRDTHLMELDFANVVYKNVLGIDLNLPKSFGEVMEGMLEIVKALNAKEIAGGKMLRPYAYGDMTPEAKMVFDMTLPDHLGGYAVDLGVDPLTMRPPHRVKTYHPEAYRPGDIFVMLKGAYAVKVRGSQNVKVAVYLGDGKVLMAKVDGTGVEVGSFEDVVAFKAVENNVMLTLRPSCTFPDTLTDYLHPAEEPAPEAPQTPETPEVPETPEAPEAPAEKGGFPVGIVIAVVAAVAIAGVVMLLILKKK